MPGIPKFLQILAVNVIVIVGLIAGLEWVSSFFLSVPEGKIVAHPRLNHTWKPNSIGVHTEWIEHNPDFPDPYVRIYNGQGWIEDYNIQVVKPESTYRIFYLGDSFTEGTCPMEESVPSRVETGLNNFVENKDLRFEVVNTGTSSYSPTIFYLLVKCVILEYSPDLIVVNIDMTDDYDDWKYSHTLVADADGNPIYAPPRDIYKSTFIDTEEGTVKATPALKAQLFLMQHSNIYRLIAGRLKKDRDAARPLPEAERVGYQRWSWCKRNWDDATISRVNYTLDLLRRLVRLCKESNVKLMFTGVPHYQQYSGRHDGHGQPAWSNRPHEALAELSQSVDVPYLNSYEYLKPIISGTPQTRYYYYRNMHFNPRGYAVWADAHLAFLTDQHNALLPREFWPSGQ